MDRIRSHEKPKILTMTYCTLPPISKFLKLIWLSFPIFCAPLESVIGQQIVEQSAPPKGEEDSSDLAGVRNTDRDEKSEADFPGRFDLDIHLQSFDQVWETVATSHWDEELIAKKWNPLKDKYRPQVESANNIGQVRKIIQSMIEELEL